MCSSLSILCWPPNFFLFQTILPEAQLIHWDAHKYELGSQNTALSVFHHQHQRSHRTYNVPCKLLLAWALAFSCKGLPQICPPPRRFTFFFYSLCLELFFPQVSPSILPVPCHMTTSKGPHWAPSQKESIPYPLHLPHNPPHTDTVKSSWLTCRATVWPSEVKVGRALFCSHCMFSPP